MRIGEITSRIGDAVRIRALIKTVALERAVSTLLITLSLAVLFLYSARLGALVTESFLSTRGSGRGERAQPPHLTRASWSEARSFNRI